MKRFYKSTSVVVAEKGYEVKLDDKTLKTPAKNALLMPTKALAHKVAEEWQQQQDRIDPETMPHMRLVSTAIDRIAPQFDSVASEIAAFGATDLLCYRAEEPYELAVRQQEQWEPYLDWLEDHVGVRLVATKGIMPIQQDKKTLNALSEYVQSYTIYELAALHGFVNGFGSLVLGLAFMNGFRDFDTIWKTSLVDQLYQEEQWGEDWEATEKRTRTYNDLQASGTFLTLLKAAP
ncbi:ATP12 family chaperone protein [Kordiimonas pumila]|uniref:ATP12 family chaperone protein n=1 Tax=Kordiimonas pumila TaxID=2161677 RepID=A0ABV7D1A0_9PROT|nr:ATP12 family protein [Kordiimonas pumila]